MGQTIRPPNRNSSSSTFQSLFLKVVVSFPTSESYKHIFPGVTISNNCRPQLGLQLLPLGWAVPSLKDTTNGATQSFCSEKLNFTSLHSLYHEYIELCTNRYGFLGLYKLTAFLSSSQSLCSGPFWSFS